MKNNRGFFAWVTVIALFTLSLIVVGPLIHHEVSALVPTAPYIPGGDWTGNIIPVTKGGTGKGTWSQACIPYLIDATTFGCYNFSGQGNEFIKINATADGLTSDSSSTSPPGTDTQVVFNDNAAWGAVSDFVFDKVNKILTVTDKLKSKMFEGTASDGEHFGYVANTDAPTYSTPSPAEGHWAWDLTDNMWRIHNGTNWTTWWLLGNWSVEGNTETLIAVTAQSDGTVDYVVDDDLSLYDNSSSGFVTASSTTTFTNKTLDANGTGNSLTNVDEDNALNGSDLVTDGICFVVDGGGSVLTAGKKGQLVIPYSATINNVTLIADQSGTVQIDINKSTYSGFPTTSSITASAVPALSSAQKYQDSTLTGWTTAITAGDILEYEVDSSPSPASITRCAVCLEVEK